MSNRLKSPGEFASYMKVLWDDLCEANIHFHTAKGMMGQSKAYRRFLNYFPEFWNSTLRAHKTMVLHCLCRVYDKDAGATHLLHLLRTIKENRDTFCRQGLLGRLPDNPSREYLADHYGEPDLTQLKDDIAFCARKSPIHRLLG